MIWALFVGMVYNKFGESMVIRSNPGGWNEGHWLSAQMDLITYQNKLRDNEKTENTQQRNEEKR